MLKLAIFAAPFAAAAAAIALTPTFAAAAAPASAASALRSSAPWWEKVTVTIAGDGKAQSCEYRTSVLPDAKKACDVVGPQVNLANGGGAAAGGAKDEFTRLTFERRFRPAEGGIRDDTLSPGDTLLGRQVLALAIDSSGAVAGCKIVASAGDMTPDYGCKEAKAEKFEAAAATSAGPAREGYLSILVYGHSEHVV